MSGCLDSLELYVLDLLADDIEDLERILRILNSDTEIGGKKEWRRRFQREEIVAALSRLVLKGELRVLVLSDDGRYLTDWPRGALPPASYGDVYFATTERGRILHASWEPLRPGEKQEQPNDAVG